MVLDFDLFVFGMFFGFVLFCFVVTDIWSKEAHYISVP